MTDFFKKVEYQKKQSWVNFIFYTILITGIYFIAGKIGFEFAIPPGNITSVWPPSGIAVGLMLLYGWKRTYLGLLIGSFIVNMAGFKLNFTEHDVFKEVVCSTSIALGSLLQAGLISYLIRRIINASFNQVFDALKFMGICISCCLIASSSGALSLCAFNFLAWKNITYTWITWLLGDAAGILLIVPLFITWKYSNFKDWNIDKFLEGILLFLSMFLVSAIIFGLKRDMAYALMFSIAPLFVWAAIRFTQFEVSLAFFLSAVIAIVNTSKGVSIFAAFEENVSYLCLQYFIAISGLTQLVISSCLYELRSVKNRIQEAYNEVDGLVKIRTKELEEVNSKLKTKILEKEEDNKKLELYHIENERLKKITEKLNNA